MIEVMVNGCNGKMGRIISELVDKNENMILKGGIDIEDFGILTYPVYTDAFKMTYTNRRTFADLLDNIGGLRC